MDDHPNKRICVYCGSSTLCAQGFLQEAEELGVVLAQNRFTIVFGGGAAGSMGSLADGAIRAGGRGRSIQAY